FSGDQGLAARILLAVIVVLTLASVGFDVVFNFWYKDFYNSLQNKNEPEFWYQIRKFSILALFYILINVYNYYLKQALHIRWRKWLTDRLLARWLSDQTYYRLQFTAEPTDNPEQRIEQDVYFFAIN